MAERLSMDADPVWDHRALNELIEIVDRDLRELRTSEFVDAETEREAVRLLDRLAEALAAHFELEEGEAGFFTEILAKAPERGGELRAIRSEHGPFREQISAIAGRAHRAGLSAAAWRQVSEDLQALLHRIRQHESAEDALVSNILSTDGG